MTATTSSSAEYAAQPIQYLNELKTNQVLDPITYEITQDRIDRYGAASLDLNPVHMNPEWCERAQVFGTPKTVQHGMMSMSYMTSVVLRTFGPLVEITSIDSKFTKIGPVGQTITCKGKVRDIHVLGNGKDYATIAVEATDADGDVVGVSEIQVRLPWKS
ncbi:MaoC family dehydratase [Roseateles sp.]|uniref:MaoC family dehydratase n=1 Tax=Roseateles sp. TaxID=1971397 RepID=UPI0039E97886